jgi:hypothetical protein
MQVIPKVNVYTEDHSSDLVSFVENEVLFRATVVLQKSKKEIKL